MAITWLDDEDVLFLHELVMIGSGERPQHAEPNRLLGAIARPRNLHAYEGEADPIRLGAHLAVAISQAQAFVDGNKRTGYQALWTFLDRNGLDCDADGLDIARWLERVAEAPGADREATTEEFVDWLHRRCRLRRSFRASGCLGRASPKEDG